MDEKDALIDAILNCNLSEGRRALIRLKKMASDIKLSTKIEDAVNPVSTTIGDKKVIKKVVTKPVKTQASG